MSALHMTLGQQYRGTRRARGFTLIELMVAMLLGLIVIGGVTSVFLAGQQTYRTNEALGDVEDGSRTAFEMLARDIRSAGLTGCDTSSGRVADTLNPSSTNWWADWNNALHGYDNATAIDDPALMSPTLPTTGATSPVKGQSSVHVISTGGLGLTVNFDTEPGASIHLNETTSDLGVGDVVMICDPDHAAIAQISGPNATNITVADHNTGASISPGNCSKGLGYPTSCSPVGNVYTYGHNSRIAKLTASDWYIGINPAGGTSLYRLSLVNTGGGPVPTPQEMVRNVASMKILYLQPPGTGFVTASNVTGISALGPPPTGWAAVDVAQITLKVYSTNSRAGTDAKAISRQFTSTTTVRNRVQ